MDKRDDPSNPSGAYAKMSPAWEMIEDILDGPAKVRSKGAAYLPKHPSEPDDEYNRRVQQAPWLPEFEDILSGLSSRPFTKDVALKDGASDRIKELAEDIDGRGNNLTAFSRPAFRSGLAFGCHAILVDNTGTGTARTVAEERKAGVRPYWVSIEADDIIDIKTAFVGGREQPYHVRIKECVIRRDGYAEAEEERIREFNREPMLNDRGDVIALGAPTWKLHKAVTGQGGTKRWEEIANGVFAPLTEIPLVLFWAGERDGPQEVQPPLYALADKQIELYRALSRKDEAYTKAGFPMLTANGLAAPQAGEPQIKTGPGRVLFAPAEGASWNYIQPDARVLEQISADVEATRDDIRRLGMQPLMPKGGDISATASSIEGAKAHSAVQAWALSFKDALEQAFVFTCQWLGDEPKVEVSVHTDFLTGVTSQPSLDALSKARAAKDISREAFLEGLVRFAVLPGDFDAEEDATKLAEELQGLMPEDPSANPLAPPPGA